MDEVVAEFTKAWLPLRKTEWVKGKSKEVPIGFFTKLEIVEGAVEAINILAQKYDIHFLSTPQWDNPYCWMEKRIWISEKFGELAYKKLTLTNEKHRFIADYLIDDYEHKGFTGKHIHFKTEEFPDWKAVLKYFDNLKDNG